jgi:micrococcal nuclease
MQRAPVIRIVDGDTFDVVLDGTDHRVRIFGVDTPERGEPCFNEATALLRTLASDGVFLQTDRRKVDRNGRLLRYVYREDGLSIDAVLIAAGVAHAWTDDGALRDALVAVEAEARSTRAGCLWE